MNLYLVTRKDETDYGEFDAMVVCCATAEEARTLHPEYVVGMSKEKQEQLWKDPWNSWPPRADLVITHIGVATDAYAVAQVILGSNRGL